ncbi:MAG: VanZ family protein [Actinomycetota bacterium]|nr:VanZ family protein [Actinomycetota bacterium]
MAYLLVPALLTLGLTPVAELQTFTATLQRVAAVLTSGRADVSVREAEALANLVLFLPLGLLLALSWPRAYLSLLLVVAGAGSLAVELTQYAVLPDRVPALLDVA